MFDETFQNRSDETQALDTQIAEEAEIRDTDIVFDCPHCGKSLVIDYRGAGLQINCCQCGEEVLELAARDFEEYLSVSMGVSARVSVRGGGQVSVSLDKSLGPRKYRVRVSKGGVAVAIQDELGVSPVFLGIGEGKDDLIPFDVDKYVNTLL